LILLETSAEFIPLFPQWVAAIPQQDLQHLVVNRPRFAPELRWSDD